MRVGSVSRANATAAKAKIAKAAWKRRFPVMAAKTDKNTTGSGKIIAGFNQLFIGRKLRLQSKPRVHPGCIRQKKNAAVPIIMSVEVDLFC
jgi:hypothetical protein